MYRKGTNKEKAKILILEASCVCVCVCVCWYACDKDAAKCE